MNYKHGHGRKGSHSPTFNCWARMIQRCTNPKHTRYAEYGARGITVCERWLVFTHFLADMGETPSGLTLERINNDGNYEPGNCRWATIREQQNNRRSSVHVTIGGTTRTIAEWAEWSGVNYKTLWGRLSRGMDPQEALA